MPLLSDIISALPALLHTLTRRALRFQDVRYASTSDN